MKKIHARIDQKLDYTVQTCNISCLCNKSCLCTKYTKDYLMRNEELKEVTGKSEKIIHFNALPRKNWNTATIKVLLYKCD